PTGFPQVYRWRDPTGAEPLTAEPLGARAPAALPDGSLLYVTLAAGGWELRHAAAGDGRRERPAGQPVPVDRPAPFAAAPPVATRETGYAAWPALRPHFWLPRSEEHTSELQSRVELVCRLLLEKKNTDRQSRRGV